MLLKLWRKGAPSQRLQSKRKKEKDCDHPTMCGKWPYFRRAMQGLRGKLSSFRLT